MRRAVTVVRSAGLEVLDAIAAVLASLRSDGVAGGAIADDDLHGGERLSSVVRHLPAMAPVVMPWAVRRPGRTATRATAAPNIQRAILIFVASGLKSGAVSGAGGVRDRSVRSQSGGT